MTNRKTNTAKWLCTSTVGQKHRIILTTFKWITILKVYKSKFIALVNFVFSGIKAWFVQKENLFQHVLHLCHNLKIMESVAQVGNPGKQFK